MHIITMSVERRNNSNITYSTLNGTDYSSGPSHLADNPAIGGPEFTATRVIYRAVPCVRVRFDRVNAHRMNVE